MLVIGDVFGSASPSAAGPPAVDDRPWQVLVVDDDEVVHVSTDIALAHVEVEGRKLRVLHAYSAHEALAIVQGHEELAVAIIDVVMETPDAGLRLVQDIRAMPRRAALRLILRTGQPGYAPELETIQHFDINDYWSKLEQSRSKLIVGLTTAIRSFRQFADIESQRDTLQQLNRQLETALQAERIAVSAREQAEKALVKLRESFESEIAQRTNELVDTVESLESFNSMVAHDLRGPLSGVSSLTSLMKRRLESGDLEKLPYWLDLVASQTERLSSLVVGLLDLSKLARAAPKRELNSLGLLVQEAIDTIRVSSPAAAHSVSFEVSPMPTLEVDPLLLRQVFVNLVGNATKFCRHADSPLVQVSVEAAESHQIVICIADNGVGFDARDAAQLFQPFVRLHGKEYEGTGIGLTTVKRIVEMHGGRVWAEATPGRGAAFRFSLPVKVPPQAAQA